MNRTTMLVKCPHGGARISLSMNWLRAASGVLALTISFGGALTPLRVGAIPYAAYSRASGPTVDIYVYQNTDDTPVLMPLAVITDGNVYTDSTCSTWIGTVNGDGRIVDANNNVVGVVVYPSPD
ncbi:MAG: hypothetical protein JWL77_3731 [Chthonomonadaceae bacterium]|nr:hypothetical protein [Chthonomonadaceae bacterium]